MIEPCIRFAAGLSGVILAAVAVPLTARATPSASYVGSTECFSCHARQYEAWRGSHHDLAMQEATPGTVLGNFSNTSFTHFGVTSTFFRRGGRYYVTTDGPDGNLHEYEIRYTFGVDPLQQYLVEFPDGRVQALSICWDTRPEQEGGQRWFHLYPNEKVDHTDILHWTGPYQNWNDMCAECHSTNVRKGYDAERDRFATTWSEIDVSCEACHGPASAHVAWARKDERERAEAPGGRGLVATFRERGPASWTIDPSTGIARRSAPRESRSEIDMCARCHALRGIVSDAYVHGRPLMDTHRPALLEAPLYEADGQIREEVYEYGSFLQSRMDLAGVTCTDCHDPHSLTVAPGNAVCARCHLPAKFDTPAHHHHAAGSRGASCVACHMTTKNYMVIDARHDHGFRVPRPDLSVKIGTPNACSGCHADRPAEWAAERAEKWWGTKRRREPHYGEAFQAARLGLPGASRALADLADRASEPGIVRASAVALLERQLDRRSMQSVARALADPDPMLRMAGVSALRSADPKVRAELLPRLLRDPVRTVRIDAARTLAPAGGLLSEEQRIELTRGLAEYRQAQLVEADRAEAHLNLGALAAEIGQHDAAERAYRTALRLNPRFAPTYVNLADLYREQNRDDRGERVLRDGLAAAPRDPSLLHALGLLLVRQKRLADALPLLESAADLSPDNPHYAYVSGVALHSAGRVDKALAALEQALERHPNDRELLQALVSFRRESGDTERAIAHARRLAELNPDDPAARQLLDSLETAPR